MYDKVRLQQKSIDAIIAAFKHNFSADDHLWIFGSRVDLAAKGGDIDLYIETSESDVDAVIKSKSKMVSQIWRAIGEQRIDVVLNILALDANLEIYKVAKTTGIKLV